MAPHLSADDGLLSRLTREGLRATRAELDRMSAQGRLQPGADWLGCGALEHRIRHNRPPALPEPSAGASRAALPAEVAAAGLPADALCIWHPQAAWVRPGALVRAWLSEPGVRFQGDARVERLVHVEPDPRDPGPRWQAQDEFGGVLAQASLVVVAAALGSAELATGRLRLQPVRGQVSWGLHTATEPIPPFAVNGSGHLLTGLPLDEGLAWLSGSSYGHGERDTEIRLEDHAANLARIRALLPATAEALAPAFASGTVRGWTGVRCASTDRRPLVGMLAPGLWALTAMGSRGLTFSALCAALLTARVGGQALPLPADLAAALDLARQR
jgi:tRNA 5-methylaminomethyl-2-thiouridine biosynthesis bifunctional protein